VTDKLLEIVKSLDWRSVRQFSLSQLIVTTFTSATSHKIELRVQIASTYGRLTRRAGAVVDGQTHTDEAVGNGSCAKKVWRLHLRRNILLRQML
jgi:hypothetical protein